MFGVGIIGMLDGIILHQMLQWHSVYMPTDRSHQIVSDGIFHLMVTGIIFVTGILLWKKQSCSKNTQHPEIFEWVFLRSRHV